MYTPQTRFTARPRVSEYGRGRAFDATGAEGMAFLVGMLEQFDPDIVEPLHIVPEDGYARDIPVKTGGGFPEWVSAYAANYKSTGSQLSGLQANDATEIPMIQFDIDKGLWKVIPWAMGMKVGFIELEKLNQAKSTGLPPPISLEERYATGIKTILDIDLNRLTYIGTLGLPGLLNNPNAPELTFPAGASGHTTWRTKTPVEILNDVNLLLNTVMANTAYSISMGMPDRLLVPWTQWSYLTQPFTLGGVAGFENIKDYIERSCVANAKTNGKFKILPVPEDWVQGAGAGSPPTDRCLCYRNNKDDVQLWIPTLLKRGMTVPVMDAAGGGWVTSYVACMSQVIFKRTQTMIYGDGL